MANIDLLEMCARDRLKQPDDWHAFLYESEGDYLIVTGGIAPILTRGPRKGQRNWKKVDPATRKRIILTREDIRKYKEAWADNTGMCPECQGKGTEFVSWSRTEGTRTRPCRHCRGTGKHTPHDS